MELTNYPNDNRQGCGSVGSAISLPVFIGPLCPRFYVEVERDQETAVLERPHWPPTELRLCKILPFHFYVPKETSDFDAARFLV